MSLELAKVLFHRFDALAILLVSADHVDTILLIFELAKEVAGQTRGTCLALLMVDHEH